MNCAGCKKLLSPSFKYCPHCGTKIISLPEKPKTTIPDRFLAVISEYESLTKTKLSESERNRFIQYPPVGQLSVNASERRIAAAKKVLKVGPNGTFRLDVVEWAKAMYDLEDPTAIRLERVWITAGGEKYHKDRNCKALTSGQSFANWKGKETYQPQYVTLKDAGWILGKLPCEICKPMKWK